MGRTSKTSALLLTVIIAMSGLTLVFVNSVSAQSIPKPSVPEFTAKFADKSYTKNGYYVNRSIQLIITNPPFSSFIDDKGNKVNMYYNISAKGHFGNDWQYYYFSHDMYSLNVTYFEATSTQFTELVFGFGSDNGSGIYNLRLFNVAGDSQLDFRVKTYFGYESIVENPYPYVPFNDHSRYIRIFNVTQTSDWSNIQTINLVNGSISTSAPTPTVPSPTHYSGLVPQNSLLIVAIVVLVIVALLAIIVFVVRHRKTVNLGKLKQ
jgi:hypothetical protein